VFIVGGTAVISANVEQQVEALGPTAERLAGANRYETAKAVSKKVFPTAPAVVIAFGENFPDALVGAAAAGANGYPVLLTGRDHLPQATIDELERLSPGMIYVVGGTAVISDTVATELGKYGTVARYAGANRYETAAAVAAKFFPNAKRAFLASGENFPDALVAAAAGGSSETPVLLVTRDVIPQATRDRLDATTPDHIWLTGGTAVISDAVFNALP
jgi:putative cell wall-binding protein